MTDNLVILTMDDLSRRADEATRARRDRRQWGHWHLHVRSLELAYRKGGRTLYLIDLERCGTSAQVLDWILQLHGKTWCTATDIGHLVTAIRDILDPQANLCSFGAGKKLDIAPYLRKRYGWGQGPGANG